MRAGAIGWSRISSADCRRSRPSSSAGSSHAESALVGTHFVRRESAHRVNRSRLLDAKAGTLRGLPTPMRKTNLIVIGLTVGWVVAGGEFDDRRREAGAPAKVRGLKHARR